MIILPQNFNTSKNSMKSLLITINIFLFISFIIMIILYLNDKYDGSFWQWSWDFKNYKLNDKLEYVEISNSGVAWIAFWIPFFAINGVALLVWISNIIEYYLDNK